MDCAEIWCVVRDQLATLFTQIKGRVCLHVRTCVPLFLISVIAERIVLKLMDQLSIMPKLGAWLWTSYPRISDMCHEWGTLHVLMCDVPHPFSVFRDPLGASCSNMLCC